MTSLSYETAMSECSGGPPLRFRLLKLIQNNPNPPAFTVLHATKTKPHCLQAASVYLSRRTYCLHTAVLLPPLIISTHSFPPPLHPTRTMAKQKNLSRRSSVAEEGEAAGGRSSFRQVIIAVVLGALIGSTLLQGHLVGKTNVAYMEEFYQDAQELISETVKQFSASFDEISPLVQNLADGAAEFMNDVTTTTTTTTTSTTSTRTDEKVAKQIPNMKRQRPTREPMNVVLFYADDWTQKVMGKLNPDVKTPNIDKMADEGVMFNENCVTTSVCWMSRATMVTGLYSARHQNLKPSDTNMFDLHPWSQTVFPQMKANGYFTGLVGKWHSPQPPEAMKQAFDWTNFYFGAHWEERDGQMRHVTDLNREDSLKFLREIRPKDKNFFLKVSFFATHAWDGRYPSYQPMNETRPRYENLTAPMPKTNTDKHWNELPPFMGNGQEGRYRWRKRWEPSYFQQNINDLYCMASEVDDVVGDVIEELKRQGVYNNTLLIFTTDNGNLHGEHGLAEKWYPFEESIRVPLVIQDPRMPKEVRGTVNEEFTLNIDLAPTILGAANLKQSYFVQGRDIAELYLDGTDDWRGDFFYEFNTGDPITAKGHEGDNWIDASFALVTKEWKYIYWPNHHYEQLFHRSMDPYDEWDLMHHPNVTLVQTTDEIYLKMKERYSYLKNWTQSGGRV